MTKAKRQTIIATRKQPEVPEQVRVEVVKRKALVFGVIVGKGEGNALLELFDDLQWLGVSIDDGLYVDMRVRVELRLDQC
ncbi:hypothetical protein ACLOJK_014270 [Asimina triloba]